MVCPSLAKVRAPFATVVLRSTDRGTGKTHNMAYQASRMIATADLETGCERVKELRETRPPVVTTNSEDDGRQTVSAVIRYVWVDSLGLGRLHHADVVVQQYHRQRQTLKHMPKKPSSIQFSCIKSVKSDRIELNSNASIQFSSVALYRPLQIHFVLTVFHCCWTFGMEHVTRQHQNCFICGVF